MVKQKKAWLSAIATIVLISVLGLAYSFKNIDTHKKLPPTTNWYSVTITGSPASNPTNQQIGSAISGTPNAPCNATSGLVCAIRLTLDDGVTKPTTVAQANTLDANNQGVDVLGTSFREED